MPKISGLYWDADTGQGLIKKQIRGTKITKRFSASTREQAEAFYHSFLASGRGKGPEERTFRSAATHYLETETKKSLDRDAECITKLDPWIGHLPLSQVHQGTLDGYIKHRRDSGVTSGTVTRELATVRRILTLAARFWRDLDGEPWLQKEPPLFRMPKWSKKKVAHVLNSDEQKRLLEALPVHLSHMVTFALNTGARESIITGLRWEWEHQIPELGRTVFIVPGEHTKNGTDCLIPINHRAAAVLEAVRGEDETWVFTYEGRGGRRPIDRINNSGWRTAWKKAELPEDQLHGPHNLRHTFARRLRNAMVPTEVIKVLLHHINGEITLHYAPSELKTLFDAVDSLTEQKVVLRAVG
jgi:integrase